MTHSNPFNADRIPAALVRLAALLALVAIASPLRAQDAASIPQLARPDDGAWRFGFHAALGLHQMSEQILAPYAFRGPSLALELGASREADGIHDDAAFRLGATATFNAHGHVALSVPFALGYTRTWEVATVLDDARLSLGAAALARLDDAYYAQWDDAHLYWMTSYMLGVAARVDRRLDDGRTVAVSLTLPLAGMLSRPPLERFNKMDNLDALAGWFGTTHERLAPATIAEYLALDLRAHYDLDAGATTRLVAGVSLRRALEPETAGVFEQQLGLLWRF